MKLPVLASPRPTRARTKSGVRARPAGLNRSVTRALDLLRYVAHASAPQSFVDLQKHHRVPKATLHKLLFTLEALDFIRRDEDTGKYSLGLAAMEVAAAGAAGPGDLAVILRPVLQKLVQESSETCHLGILNGEEEVILSRIEPEEQVVLLAPQIGRRHPAYASAGGLASMALRLDESVITSMSEELRQLTPNTIKTRTELLTRLDEVRKTGICPRSRGSLPWRPLRRRRRGRPELAGGAREPLGSPAEGAHRASARLGETVEAGGGGN